MDKEENEIIELIYDASMNCVLWQEVVKRIAEHTGSKAAILTALDQMCPGYDFIYTYNIPQESLMAYQDERIAVIDMQLHQQPLIDKGIGNALELNLMHYAEKLDTDEYLFYEKCMKPTGIASLCGMLLEQGHTRWAVLGVHRAEGTEGISKQQIEFLHRIGKHLRRALQIYRQFSMVKQENQNLQSVLDHMKTGVILLNQKQNLAYSNKNAQKIMEKYDAIRLDRFNKVKVPSQAQSQFDQLVNGTFLNGTHTDVNNGGVMSIVDDRGNSLILSIIPYNNHEIYEQNNTNISGKFAAIFITEVDRKYTLARPYLQQNFGLVNREVEMCEYLVNGYGLDEIAENARLTMSTVRTYIKYIYAKTGCSSQTQLMHFLMGTTTNFEHIY